ncbi:hypothetical protein VNO77_16152 [Canavalia gladiata]|uniref:Uncharacterized protein n=1 Tax=Canavalia gladiata TaxID=3824 RepID=A0AAN9M5C3_CANGL
MRWCTLGLGHEAHGWVRISSVIITLERKKWLVTPLGILTLMVRSHFVYLNYLIRHTLFPFHVHFSVLLSCHSGSHYHFVFPLLPNCPISSSFNLSPLHASFWEANSSQSCFGNLFIPYVKFKT